MNKGPRADTQTILGNNMNAAREFPQLETARLILRELTLDDADVIFPHFANKEVARYIDYEPAESIKDVTDIINWGTNLFNKKAGTLWGIFRKEDSSFLGQVNYIARPDDNFTGSVHRAEIGYELTPPYWGKGYMSEAICSVIEHVFSSTKLNRIEAKVHTENNRSLSVLTRLGFHREGILRGYVQWGDGFWDMVLFSMLKKDWVE